MKKGKTAVLLSWNNEINRDFHFLIVTRERERESSVYYLYCSLFNKAINTNSTFLLPILHFPLLSYQLAALFSEKRITSRCGSFNYHLFALLSIDKMSYCITEVMPCFPVLYSFLNIIRGSLSVSTVFLQVVTSYTSSRKLIRFA